MATPTTYGSRDRNTFIIPSTYELNGISVPSNNGDTKYYPLVNSVTGEITIKSPAVRTISTLGITETLAGIGTTVPDAIGADRTVGIIPKDGVFKPELGSATTSEVQYFNSAVGQKAVKNQAVITAQKEGAQNAQQLIFPNSATPGAGTPGAGTPGAGTPGAGDNASTAPAPTTQFSQEQAIAAIESLDVRPSYRRDLSYPITRNKNQDYIKFEMLEYSPRKFNAPTLDAFERGVDAGLGQKVFGDERLGAKDRKPIGTVTLPISSPISDTNTVNWNDDSIGALNALGQGAFGGLLGLETAQSENQPPPPPAGQGGSGATKALAITALSKAAVGGNNNILTRTTGAIVNPNLELLFNGPNLRTFSFTFPMSARSEKEAKNIKEIIRFFKQGMSVKRSTSSLFLKSPHTFNIKYIYAVSNKDHPWINLIKECALTNCSVNYTPAGNYATYANGAMTMYEITLNFSELEPVFDDDYAKIDGNAAGKDTMIGY